MEVVVEDKQLSLAIGKKGQNVRLAAKLTGWRIDIKSEEEKRREVEAQFEGLEAAVDGDCRPSERRGATPERRRTPATTSRCRTRSLASAKRPCASSSRPDSPTLEAVAAASVEQLSEIPGIGEKTAEKILAAARGDDGRRAEPAGRRARASESRSFDLRYNVGNCSDLQGCGAARHHQPGSDGTAQARSRHRSQERVEHDRRGRRAPVRRSPRPAAQHHAADRRHLRRDAGRQGQEAALAKKAPSRPSRRRPPCRRRASSRRAKPAAAGAGASTEARRPSRASAAPDVEAPAAAPVEHAPAAAGSVEAAEPEPAPAPEPSPPPVEPALKRHAATAPATAAAAAAAAEVAACRAAPVAHRRAADRAPPTAGRIVPPTLRLRIEEQRPTHADAAAADARRAPRVVRPRAARPAVDRAGTGARRRRDGRCTAGAGAPVQPAARRGSRPAPAVPRPRTAPDGRHWAARVRCRRSRFDRSSPGTAAAARAAVSAAPGMPSAPPWRWTSGQRTSGRAVATRAATAAPRRCRQPRRRRSRARSRWPRA